MAKKCLCFSRVSSLRQGLTAQRAAVMAAALKEYKESEIIEVSGKESAIKLDIDERQTLNEMKSLVDENPHIESIYFFAVDRLSRRVSVVISIKEWADERQINLVFLNPYPFSTWFRNTDGEWKKNEISDIYLMFLGYGAKMEMEIKGERFAAAKKWLRENNKVTGKLLYGYKADDKKNIAIDKEKAKVIKWCFDCYLKKGMSTTEIFMEGVELGYWKNLTLRTSKANKVRVYLKNFAYAGIPQEGGVTYPQIVGVEEVEAAIKLMNEKVNKPTKSLTNNIYYCKGILKDEETNTCLIVDRNHVRYKATNARHLYGLNLNICDSLIWKTALGAKWILMSNNDDTQEKEAQKQMKDIADKIVNLRNILDKDVSQKFTKAYEAYINSRGRITLEHYNETIDELEKEQKQIEKQIELLEQRETELSNVLVELSRKVKRDIDLYTIGEIENEKHRLEIIKECITNMTIKKINKTLYVIKVYSILPTSPNVYIHEHRSPTKTYTYWVVGKLNFDNIDIIKEVKEQTIIDISSEIENRYKRVYK